MNNSVIGELSFKYGWKTSRHISFFDNEVDICVTLAAYFEEDGITKEQENAYQNYENEEGVLLKKAEYVLASCCNNPSERFKARNLLFSRNGDIALLCDDEENPDEGIAITLMPNISIISQDDYL